MTENDFLSFMDNAWKGGRACKFVCKIDSGNGEIDAQEGYLRGHMLLPRGYDLIKEADLQTMAELLFKKGVKNSTKEIILMILAHQPSKAALLALKGYNCMPDPGLEIFASLALSECLMWNE